MLKFLKSLHSQNFLPAGQDIHELLLIHTVSFDFVCIFILEKMAAEVWKVFVPYDLLIQSDSFLLGHVSLKNQSVYITASCQQVSEAQNSLLEFVGVWKNEVTLEQNQSYSSRPAWINLWTDPNQTVHCSVLIDKSKVSCTSIIYNPKDLLNSSVLTHRLDTSRYKVDEGNNTMTLISVLKSTPSSKGMVHEPAVLYYGPQEDKRSVLDYLACFILWNFIGIYEPFRWLLVKG